MEQHRRQQAIAQQREVMNGCLAVYEAMRRFGFKPEELFFDNRVSLPNPIPLGPPMPCVGMTVRAQSKEFVTNCGPRIDPSIISDDELLSLWDHHAGRWNTGMTTQARMEIWCTKMPPQLLISLANGMRNAGFFFPNPDFERSFPPLPPQA